MILLLFQNSDRYYRLSGLFLERSFISWIFQTCEDIWKNINDEFLLSQDCSHKMCNFCLCVHTQMVLGNLVQNCPVWSNKVILDSQIYKKGHYEQHWGRAKIGDYSVVSIKRTGSLNYFEGFYHPDCFFYVLNEIFAPPCSLITSCSLNRYYRVLK